MRARQLPIRVLGLDVQRDGMLARTSVFQACAVNRSASPLDGLAALLPEHQVVRAGVAGRTALAVSLKALTCRQIQEQLRTQGVEVTPEFAAQLQLDAVQQLEHSEVPGDGLHKEHASAPVDRDDGAVLHQTSVGQEGACGDHPPAAPAARCAGCRLHDNREGRTCACSLRATQRASAAAALWFGTPLAVLALCALLFGWIAG
jgi:hypothetical protein